MTSTHAVGAIKRLFTAKRAGHAGTLDPLASGMLPVALGEATKTVPFVMDGRKLYRFTVAWGEERDTDDAEGRVVEQSAARPSAEAIRAAAAVLRRHHPAGTAAVFRHQGRGRARLRSRSRRREGRARRPPGRDRPPGPHRDPRPRPCRVRGRMRQRDLCALARPRHGACFGLFWPRLRAAAGRSRPLWRGNHDFTGRTGGAMP